MPTNRTLELDGLSLGLPVELSWTSNRTSSGTSSGTFARLPVDFQ